MCDAVRFNLLIPGCLGILALFPGMKQSDSRPEWEQQRPGEGSSNTGTRCA